MTRIAAAHLPAAAIAARLPASIAAAGAIFRVVEFAPAEALRLAFSQDDFKACYRAAMKANHPDIAGANDRAAAINAAAATIRKRKDWR